MKVEVKEIDEHGRIKLSLKDKEYFGYLMPKGELSHKDVIILKLESGYNIGRRLAVCSLMLGQHVPNNRKGIANRVSLYQINS